MIGALDLGILLARWDSRGRRWVAMPTPTIAMWRVTTEDPRYRLTGWDTDDPTRGAPSGTPCHDVPGRIPAFPSGKFPISVFGTSPKAGVGGSSPPTDA